jgi:hypothetical protein
MVNNTNVILKAGKNAEFGREEQRRMYSRKISVAYELEGRQAPCPMKWLDNFAMRNFTNDPVFDDTIPVADGMMEVGTRVPLDRLRHAMEDWFRRKGYLGRDAALVVEEKQPFSNE